MKAQENLSGNQGHFGGRGRKNDLIILDYSLWCGIRVFAL
jgi:hypothetical protein